MGESLNGLLDNGVNGTGAFCEGASSGRCPVGEQRRPGRHPVTARMMWSKDVNKVVMECYLKSKPVNENGVPIRGYRQRMFRVWQEIGLFESTEQRICDQARAIRKNGWLSELEIEVIKRKINQEETGDTNVQGLGDATTDENMENDEVQQEEGEFDMQDEPGNDANSKELNDISEEDRRLISEILELSKSGENNPVNFKKANRRQVEEITNRINKVIDKIPTRTITETNNLINAASMYVAKELGLKQTTQKQSKMPWWQRRIEGDIKRIRKDINLLEREKRGELRKSGKMEQLEKKYNIKGKGITTVLEELKQRILAKAAKIKRYDQRRTQYKQNILFKQDQKRFYQELNGTARNENVIPDADESKKFWSDIWSVGKEHNRSAEWLNNIKNDIKDNQQGELEITSYMVTSQCRKLPNWKAPDKDGV